MVVQVGRLDRGIRKRPAAGETAAAAIGARHHLLDLIDPRIFLDPELLRDEEEDEGEQQTEAGEDSDGPKKCCRHRICFIVFSVS